MCLKGLEKPKCSSFSHHLFDHRHWSLVISTFPDHETFWLETELVLLHVSRCCQYSLTVTSLEKWNNTLFWTSTHFLMTMVPTPPSIRQKDSTTTQKNMVNSSSTQGRCQLQDSGESQRQGVPLGYVQLDCAWFEEAAWRNDRSDCQRQNVRMKQTNVSAKKCA